MTIAVVLVLGLSLVIFASRDNEATADDTAPAANVDHWHAAYGIYACDAFLDPLQVQDRPRRHPQPRRRRDPHPPVRRAARREERHAPGVRRRGRALKLSDDEIDSARRRHLQER